MHTATYCPEDNKLRLYVGRVPRDEYEALRKAGFASSPKQDCDFVATWTPGREDMIRDMYLDDDEDIGDEDYSPQERADDRADRFEGYRDKRRSEAHGHADNFDARPQVFGHQNQRRAERAAARHDRQRTRAVSQWSKAEYWQQRTAGVISHSLYKSKPKVRRRRILELERLQRGRAATLEVQPDSETDRRWVEHYDMRIMYERAMLEAHGGSADQDEIEVGYVTGSHFVVKVNRSSATKRPVSVQLVDGELGSQPRRSVNIQDLAGGQFRPPTDEEQQKFAAWKVDKKQRDAAAREKSPVPKLINPTLEDAERLQAIWNARAKEPSEVRQMTQQAYSAMSRGDYGSCETVGVNEKGLEQKRRLVGHCSGRTTVFKVRKCQPKGFHSAYRVVVLTDKPQKPLPFEELERVRASMPQDADVACRIEDVNTCCDNWQARNDESMASLFADAVYCGFATSASSTQASLTDKGRKALAQCRANATGEESSIQLKDYSRFTAQPELGAPFTEDEHGRTYQKSLFAEADA